ncbi:MAG: DNA-binding protein [Acidobacteria bacterium]|nr:MAG: DNA-binding protein [Acidobacteriota bacterium]
MPHHSSSDFQPKHSPSDLLTEAEAAEFIGLQHPKTLAVWRSTKRYPLAYIKVGRLVRYHRSDLLAFLESRRV